MFVVPYFPVCLRIGRCGALSVDTCCLHQIWGMAVLVVPFRGGAITVSTKWFSSSRLETRTKESNMCASAEVENLSA